MPALSFTKLAYGVLALSARGLPGRAPSSEKRRRIG